MDARIRTKILDKYSSFCFYAEISIDVLECCAYDTFEEYMNDGNLNIPLSRRYDNFMRKLRIMIEIKNLNGTEYFDEKGVNINIKPTNCYALTQLPKLFKTVMMKLLTTIGDILNLKNLSAVTAHIYKSVSI